MIKIALRTILVFSGESKLSDAAKQSWKIYRIQDLHSHARQTSSRLDLNDPQILVPVLLSEYQIDIFSSTPSRKSEVIWFIVDLRQRNSEGWRDKFWCRYGHPTCAVHGRNEIRHGVCSY